MVIENGEGMLIGEVFIVRKIRRALVRVSGLIEVNGGAGVVWSDIPRVQVGSNRAGFGLGKS